MTFLPCLPCLIVKMYENLIKNYFYRVSFRVHLANSMLALRLNSAGDMPTTCLKIEEKLLRD